MLLRWRVLERISRSPPRKPAAKLINQMMQEIGDSRKPGFVCVNVTPPLTNVGSIASENELSRANELEDRADWDSFRLLFQTCRCRSSDHCPVASCLSPIRPRLLICWHFTSFILESKERMLNITLSGNFGGEELTRTPAKVQALYEVARIGVCIGEIGCLVDAVRPSPMQQLQSGYPCWKALTGNLNLR